MAENAPTTTVNVTRDIAKELTFEDISVHSPGLFRKGDAMRALRENPSTGTFRRALAELNQTTESFARILDAAREKALGNSEADLERIKTNIKRLKFGTIELGTERAFLRSILESRPLPRAPPEESDAFRARNASLKQLKDANDANEKVVEDLVTRVGASAAALEAEKAHLAARVDALEGLERDVDAAELASAGVAKHAAPDPADEHLTDAEARAMLDELDAEATRVNAALRARESEAMAMRSALEPGEAALAECKAELALLAGAGRAMQREAKAMAEIAETDALIREQKALVETLQGVRVVSVDDGGVRLTLSVRTALPPTEKAIDGEGDFDDAGREKEHLMRVEFHPGSVAVKDASLEPADVPIEDVVAVARSAADAQSALSDLLCETRTRVAATAARMEALSKAAANGTAVEWNAMEAIVRAPLSPVGTLAMEVPFEWPMNGARVRVVGLAGFAPAIVAAAAGSVDPAGYGTVEEAVTATRDALAAATAA